MPMHQHIVIMLNTFDMLQNIVKYTKHFKLNKLQHTFTSSIKQSVFTLQQAYNFITVLH